MKVALFCLLWGNLYATAVHASLSGLHRVWISGREYVRLEDWARAHHFDCHWAAKNQTCKLTSKWSTLIFTVDARKMTLNDVDIWLAAPVALRGGSACVASVDLETAIHPVLYPDSGYRIRTICIDPGHGGKDPGNQAGKQQEKKFTLLLAKEVRDLLQKNGLNAVLTRDNDTFLELDDRPAIARRLRADLFVSIHFNSVPGTSGRQVRGIETYSMTPARTSSTNARGEGANSGAYPGNRHDTQNMTLAYEVQKALLKGLPVADRGVRRARFAVLRNAQMPAVLIEGGFMTHPTESKNIFSSAYRRQMAQAIVNGLLAYKKRVD